MATHSELDVPQLPTAAADRLREWIVAGRLRPSQRVRERDFAERFGISRTPLREALRLLQQEGLITGDPRRGMLVSPLSLDEIASTYQVIAALERAALLHTPAVVPEMARRLRSATRKREAAEGHAARMRAADLEWHVALSDYSSNKSLQRMLEAPRNIADRYERAFFESAEDVARSSTEHVAIEAAVVAGELEKAADMIEAHWLGNVAPMADIITRKEAGDEI